jgi:EAL domain-containing protein (putative c-di-GMP-specific phosphodiesterase class I)
MAYQSIISLNTRKLFGYEALLRPKNNKPEALIARAAKNGELLGLEAAICSAISQEFIGVMDDITLFINLTPTSYSYARGAVIMDALSHLKPGKVVIELTEIHLLPDDIKIAAEAWRKKGYRLAIDDVSSGYSRLTAIAELEPDFIKIDRPCVTGALKSNSWQEVLKCVVNMAKSINSKIIGEGIETKAEMELLTKYGVDYGQGYYIGRPFFLRQVI